jgi:acetyltransferase-like isoleucine patch superfamily enzyme
MLGLIYRGIQHLREYGAFVTLVETVRWASSRVEKRYYHQKVSYTAKEVGANLTVNGPSRVTRDTVLGNNVNFNGMAVRGGGTVTIGDNFHSGPDCLIMTRNHNYDNGSAIPYDDTYTYKEVEIGDNVWFGARVTVIPGVTIGEGAIIQGGSTVTSDIPKGAIAGGHPAEVFDQRDMEHYERLKAKGKFH